MSQLLNAKNLTQSFGARTLFSGITLGVGQSDRLAVIGPNGSGKSTLLKILAGLEDADGGDVVLRSGVHLTYVAQQDLFDEDLDLYQIIETALQPFELSPQETSRRIHLALGEAGFTDSSVTIRHLSGGWRKRLAIARGIATEPDLLLLDEPTNHLDIDGILWLERYLRKFNGAVVFISHDRYFIEHLASRVMELNPAYPGGTFSSNGSYVDFLEARSNFLEGLRQTRASLENKVRREVDWLRAGVKARTTKSRSRIQSAEKMIDRLESFQNIREMKSLPFAATDRKSKELIKVVEAGKRYGDRTLFKEISLTVSPGNCIGVVGPNGSGKTTFIRMLLGQITPDWGTVRQAKNLRVAFFDQAKRQLDRDLPLKRVLAPESDSVIFGGETVHVAAWAARFLFSNHQLDLPVSALSGGEQARALLAKLMAEPADVMLFDEPTNDLDIATLEVMEEGFNDFPGAIVLVTHDRYLLDRTATMVVGLTKSGGAIFGDLAQWEEAYEAEKKSTKGRDAQDNGASRSDRQARTKTRLGYQEQRELDGIEAKILAAEEKLEGIKSTLNEPGVASDSKRLVELTTGLATQEELVSNLYARWEELESKRAQLVAGEASEQ
jgi:ABC transport system ATP-binding/permease protein